ncbi:enoyl-CoA hydratase/isomerase family protein [Bradyrhizobium sp. LTSP885]|uniref:enoyl-CoA hydratase/isomerase family protein n=1 Tax=Bradyrhizobium sp. LTSP885 TaxID=1619232 RepID=UPI0005C8D653|nr:enoyl-CoA hydratase/isomerase family protein [Bradyrhizobium sp. LTSP885]
MTTANIRIRRTDGKAEIVLDNPGRRNAISAGMWEELRSFADSAQADATLRTLVIRGEGSVFSAGADIAGFDSARKRSDAQSYDDLVESTLRALEQLPQVVIAAISGPCVGAGASLACACDIRVAERESFFAVPAARLGLGYDPRGISRFVRIFGKGATSEMLLLAARMAGPRAFELGAIHRLVAPGASATCANTLAELASSLAPLTQRAAKASIQEHANGTGISSAVLELAARADASLDYEEGRAAFAQKRPPIFRGR